MPKSRAEIMAERFLAYVRSNHEVNLNTKARFTDKEKRYWINESAKSITCYAFRNGPVETMHARGQLSQSDMKVLNKFIVNQLALVFELLFEDRWCEFESLVLVNNMYTHDWDEPEPPQGDMKDAIGLLFLMTRPSQILKNIQTPDDN